MLTLLFVLVLALVLVLEEYFSRRSTYDGQVLGVLSYQLEYECEYD